MKHVKKREDVQIICPPYLRVRNDSPVCTRGAGKRGGGILTKIPRMANIQVTYELNTRIHAGRYE